MDTNIVVPRKIVNQAVGKDGLLYLEVLWQNSWLPYKQAVAICGMAMVNGFYQEHSVDKLHIINNAASSKPKTQSNSISKPTTTQNFTSISSKSVYEDNIKSTGPSLAKTDTQSLEKVTGLSVRGLTAPSVGKTTSLSMGKINPPSLRKSFPQMLPHPNTKALPSYTESCAGTTQSSSRTSKNTSSANNSFNVTATSRNTPIIDWYSIPATNSHNASPSSTALLPKFSSTPTKNLSLNDHNRHYLEANKQQHLEVKKKVANLSRTLPRTLSTPQKETPVSLKNYNPHMPLTQTLPIRNNPIPPQMQIIPQKGNEQYMYLMKTKRTNSTSLTKNILDMQPQNNYLFKSIPTKQIYSLQHQHTIEMEYMQRHLQHLPPRPEMPQKTQQLQMLRVQPSYLSPERNNYYQSIIAHNTPAKTPHPSTLFKTSASTYKKHANVIVTTSGNISSVSTFRCYEVGMKLPTKTVPLSSTSTAAIQSSTLPIELTIPHFTNPKISSPTKDSPVKLNWKSLSSNIQKAIIEKINSPPGLTSPSLMPTNTMMSVLPNVSSSSNLIFPSIKSILTHTHPIIVQQQEQPSCIANTHALTAQLKQSSYTVKDNNMQQNSTIVANSSVTYTASGSIMPSSVLKISSANQLTSVTTSIICSYSSSVTSAVNSCVTTSSVLPISIASVSPSIKVISMPSTTTTSSTPLVVSSETTEQQQHPDIEGNGLYCRFCTKQFMHMRQFRFHLQTYCKRNLEKKIQGKSDEKSLVATTISTTIKNVLTGSNSVLETLPAVTETKPTDSQTQQNSNEAINSSSDSLKIPVHTSNIQTDSIPVDFAIEPLLGSKPLSPITGFEYLLDSDTFDLPFNDLDGAPLLTKLGLNTQISSISSYNASTPSKDSVIADIKLNFNASFERGLDKRIELTTPSTKANKEKSKDTPIKNSVDSKVSNSSDLLKFTPSLEQHNTTSVSNQAGKFTNHKSVEKSKKKNQLDAIDSHSQTGCVISSTVRRKPLKYASTLLELHSNISSPISSIVYDLTEDNRSLPNSPMETRLLQSMDNDPYQHNSGGQVSPTPTIVYDLPEDTHYLDNQSASEIELNLPGVEKLASNKDLSTVALDETLKYLSTAPHETLSSKIPSGCNFRRRMLGLDIPSTNLKKSSLYNTDNYITNDRFSPSPKGSSLEPQNNTELKERRKRRNSSLYSLDDYVVDKRFSPRPKHQTNSDDSKQKS